SLARTDFALYLPRMYVLPPIVALELLPREVRGEVDTERYSERIRGFFDECSKLDPITRRIYVDLNSSLADEMLAKVDRMTMAWGLEARVPLLDHRLVELAMRVTGPVKRIDPVGKLPLRRLVEKYLGRETSERPKHGFNSPWPRWLRHDSATRT